MGQKVNPNGLRLGVIQGWKHKWYDKKNYSSLVHEDLRIRKFIESKLEKGEISKLEITRYPERIIVNIHTARPGVVIGKAGKDIENLKTEVGKLTPTRIHINIVEVKDPDLSAKLVADNIARQIRNRVAYTKAMKQALFNSMKRGAKGVKIMCSGRLGGAEMSRIKVYKEGRIPLHTIRADIEYGFAEALTTYGLIGVKVWVFKGEIIGKPNINASPAEAESQRKRNRRRRDQRESGDEGGEE